jgi:hypothetical protein
MGVAINYGVFDDFSPILNISTNMPCLRRGVRMGDLNADGAYFSKVTELC